MSTPIIALSGTTHIVTRDASPQPLAMANGGHSVRIASLTLEQLAVEVTQ